MEDAPDPNPAQENFGEATLGEAQSESPPADPEMLETPSEGEAGGGESSDPAEGGAEEYGGDQDAEGTAGDEGGSPHPDSDQAEG